MTYKDLFRKFKVNEGEQATYEKTKKSGTTQNLFINLSALPLREGFLCIKKAGPPFPADPKQTNIIKQKKFGNIMDYNTLSKTREAFYGIILM